VRAAAVTLTEDGLANVQQVVSLILQYLTMLRREGPQKWLFDEFAAVAAAAFQFAEEIDPVEYCENIACEMQHFNDADILVGDTLYQEWGPQSIADLLDLMRADKMNLVVCSKSCAELCTSTEPWFGAKYAAVPIEAAWSAEWIDNEKKEFVAAELHLPAKNNLVTKDFSLLDAPVPEPAAPAIVLNTEAAIVWYQPDSTFRMPRCSVTIQLVTPKLYSSPESTSLFDIYVSVMALNLKAFAYAARLAEMEYQFSALKNGYVIRLYGFNEKLPVLLSLILKQMKEFEIDEQKLSVSKEQLVRRLKNAKLDPANAARSYRLQLLDTQRWDEAAHADVIASLQLDEVKGFAKTFFKEMYLKMLVHGNLSAVAAADLGKEVVSTLEITKLSLPMHPVERIVGIEPGTWALKVNNANADDDNSVLEIYYQIGGNELSHLVMTDLLQDIMSEPIFNELRTNQALGYYVAASTRMTFGHLGYMISIQPQASKFTVAEVDKRVDGFLKWFETYLADLSDADFANHISAALNSKLRPESNLSERTNVIWGEIAGHTYMFDRKHQEAAALRQVTKQGLIEWYKQTLHPASPARRKVAVWVVGNGEASKTPRRVSTSQAVGEKDKKVVVHAYEGYEAPTFIDSVTSFRQDRQLLASPLDVLQHLEC